MLENGKNLANTAVGMDIPGGEKLSKAPVARMNGCIWVSQMCDRRQERGSVPHSQCDECQGPEVGLYSGIMGNYGLR